MIPALLLISADYLCGSLPTGVWLGRRAGIDVRRSGSGNIGASNVARTAGVRPALLTLIGDVAKGLLPVLAARALLHDPRAIAAVGVAAVCGHVWSVFLRFSGGKGVATGFGFFLALTPPAALIAAVVFGVAARLTRYASVASLLAALSLPAATAALGYERAYWVAALVVAAIIVARHRDNLRRLRSGREPQFRAKR